MERYTFSAIKANLLAIPLSIVQVMLFTLPFFFFIGKQNWLAGLGSYYFKPFIFLPILIMAGFIHELLHVSGFMIFGKARKTDLKLGMIWKYFTPYAHCKIAVTAIAYRIALLLPYFILGVLPILFSFILKSVWLNIFGLIFCISAAGDLLVFWKIRKVSKSELLKDHPSECGCELISNK